MSGRGRRPIRARHVVLGWMVIYFPWLPGWPLRLWFPEMPFALVVDANLAAQFALIAFSLVILTGWVGQISLGQGAFVGIGAFATGYLSRNWGIPFPLSLPLVALLTAGTATLLGLVALRVRGLYLAVATLLFAWMADAYLFSASWFVGAGGSTSIKHRVIGHPEGITVFDLSNERTLYLVTVAVLAAAWFCAVNLRDSRTGRAFFAIRGSETAAVSLGVDVIRYKLLAFALSGGLAGVAGGLIMVDLQAVTPTLFQFTVSLFYLGIAVVGGITSLGGAVAAGALFALLTEVFFRVELLDGWLDVVTIALLLGILLGYPGGLGALGPRLSGATQTLIQRFRAGRAWVRDRISSLSPFEQDREADEEHGRENHADTQSNHVSTGKNRATRARTRLRSVLPRRRRRHLARPSIDLEVMTSRPSLITTPSAPLDWRDIDLSGFSLPRRRQSRERVLEADSVVVQFGGLRAVDNVSLSVRRNEIVGLIGPNGAGKTTTFNAIAGLNEPASGAIRLFGHDVTPYPPHVRAQMGMGRTFQLIQLFPELTVFDNLLVATHVQNPTGVFGHVLLTERAVRAERRARRTVQLVIDMFRLQEVAGRSVAGLPFGVLRQVEIARAVVSGTPLIMLDEPASGLDNAETDVLSQLLHFLRAELGISILLIEHDVRMVTSVTDYIYVLNQGALLAEGTPDEIQRNPAVVAAYLGQADTPPAADEDTDTTTAALEHA